MITYDISDIDSWPTSIGIYSIYGEHNSFHLVGQTKNRLGFKARWQKHVRMLKQNNHYNKYLQSSWNKHGENSFKLTVLETCEMNDDLNHKEILWIDKLNSMCDENGWNLTTGGKVTKFSDSTIEKMRNKIFTETHRENISNALTGKKASKETKEKQSTAKAKTYILINPEGVIMNITNLEKFGRDNELDPSSLLQVFHGKCRQYKGWTSPIYYREKFKTGPLGKEMVVKSPFGEILKFNNMSSAAKHIGVSSSNISYLRSGKFKHCKGYTLYES